MEWTTDRLREAFLDYFEQKGHLRESGSGLIPSDPSMLFTSAGMVQFKDVFWGRKEPEHTRVATCQKCFRATDIERVGKTAYHHTFFEMLGNFSFGDYFKEGAIELAWEFVTEVLGLPPERLWVSVYREDDESHDIWVNDIGVPPERIERLGKDENWWGPVGGSGPCGPDSEIFFDYGPDYGCGEDCKGVACDCNRFNELWNLVFTGYEMDEEGNVRELASQNIDTGMGLERTAAVLQGVETDFEIDIFKPIVDAVEGLYDGSETTPEDQERVNRIADHVRGASFLISEGVIPSNEERGYVLRRIIRRAVRAGQSLGLTDSFLTDVVPSVFDTMGDYYPQLIERDGLIRNILSTEEENFRETLSRGERLFQDLVSELESEGVEQIPGNRVFELYDTHGIPPDLIEQMAAEHDLDLDMKGFREEMEQQRERGRSGLDFEETDLPLQDLPSTETDFTGYSHYCTEAEIIGLFVDSRPVDLLEKGTETESGIVVLDRTPFYAEAGGQVSDRGSIITQQGRAEVEEVESRDGVYCHHVRVKEGELNKGSSCQAVLDERKRKATERNHTATHLLHQSLQEVLGPHVVQSGSQVGPDELRFDFNHYEQISPDDVRAVEDKINQLILQNRPVLTDWVESLEEAKSSGAAAHFEEEYRSREKLRIVSVEDYSKELCGGTHVDSTGEIGSFLICSTETIASGIRRIRAVTGEGALRQIRNYQGTLQHLSDLTSTSPEDLVPRVESLLNERQELERELEQRSSQLLSFMKDQLLEGSQPVDGFSIIRDNPDLPPQQLKRLADMLEREVEGVVLLGTESDGAASLVCKVSESLWSKVTAGEIMKEMAAQVDGGGGGDRGFAQGGGPKVETLPEALDAASEYVKSRIGSSEREEGIDLR